MLRSNNNRFFPLGAYILKSVYTKERTQHLLFPVLPPKIEDNLHVIVRIENGKRVMTVDWCEQVDTTWDKSNATSNRLGGSVN